MSKQIAFIFDVFIEHVLDDLLEFVRIATRLSHSPGKCFPVIFCLSIIDV